MQAENVYTWCLLHDENRCVVQPITMISDHVTYCRLIFPSRARRVRVCVRVFFFRSHWPRNVGSQLIRGWARLVRSPLRLPDPRSPTSVHLSRSLRDQLGIQTAPFVVPPGKLAEVHAGRAGLRGGKDYRPTCECKKLSVITKRKS